MVTDTSSKSLDWIGDPSSALPTSSDHGTLVGRVWNPAVNGPSPVVIRDGSVFDLSATFSTMSELCEVDDPSSRVRNAPGELLGRFDDIFLNSQHGRRDESTPWFIAPHDLQAIKASGVTFATSMIERVIEERSRGDQAAAGETRAEIMKHIGGDLRELVPGSERAAELKAFLLEQGMWSQYLEVGIGPDAEIFTKAPPLSSVGTGAEIGVLSTSLWNNPEPEVVLVINSSGTVVGATLGNDVNLRDIEGRSALLLPKAKDNTSSCSSGPFIRLFDETFTMDTVRQMEVDLTVEGTDDGFLLESGSDMSQISRDPSELVSQLIGPQHQYPDGVVLMLGTLFTPVKDRGEPGNGFTHHVGDIVRIHAPELGTLTNRVQHSEQCEPWVFGTRHLMKNLSERQLL